MLKIFIFHNVCLVLKRSGRELKYFKPVSEGRFCDFASTRRSIFSFRLVLLLSKFDL